MTVVIDMKMIRHSNNAKCFIMDASCYTHVELDVTERGSSQHRSLNMIQQKQCCQVTHKHRYIWIPIK